MLVRWIKRGLMALAVLAAAAGLWWAFSARPVAVDAALVAQAPMRVMIEEEGVTRVREIYRVSAPVDGRIDRSLLSVGDRVSANLTVIARINPLEPPFLNERARAELLAQAGAARAGVALAEAQQQQAEAALAQARAELERAVRLAESNTISKAQLETARSAAAVAEAQLASAMAQVKLRKSELASVLARLIQPGDTVLQEPGTECCVDVRAPIDGVILSLAAKSEQVVAAGSPLAEIGDPAGLEIVIALLSADAVRIAPGTPAEVTGWGGAPLPAKVRLISPSAKTVVSALGIEEQRVDAILSLEGADARLGHGFGVRAAIELWSSPAALTVPISALFRRGNDWAAFRIESGAAHEVRVSIGHMNAVYAEVLDGLKAGDSVIVHPGDAVIEGAEVTLRDEG